jgi:hypothetical protein
MKVSSGGREIFCGGRRCHSSSCSPWRVGLIYIYYPHHHIIIIAIIIIIIIIIIVIIIIYFIHNSVVAWIAGEGGEG